MASILDLLGSQLDSSTVDRLGRQVGATPEQARAAVATALPALLGALQRNSASPRGADALGAALDRDHDGAILDDLGALLGGGPSASNERSLDHIFGNRRGNVEDAVASRAGLDRGQAMQLLAMLAPLVLGALSRARQRGGAAGDAGPGGGGLADILGGALGQLRQRGAAGGGGGLGGGLGGILGGMLDRDGDGSFLDDLLGGSDDRREDRGAGAGGGAGGGILDDLLGGLGGGRR
jgi:hypothetical protein